MKLTPSISTRLFISFFGLLVIALGSLGGISVYWFIQNESERLNQFLDTEAKSVSNRLEGIVEGLNDDGTLTNDNVDSALVKDLSHYLSQRVNRPLPYKTTLIVLDGSGLILGQSNTAIDFGGGGVNLKPGETRIEDIRDRGPAYRVLSSHFELDRGTFGTFRIACFLDSLDQPFWPFIISLSIVLVGSLVLLTALGWWLILFTLRPVRNMAMVAGNISDQNLAARIPVPPGNDDLSQLAVTLNGLLAQLETDFAFQERLVGELTHELKTPLTILRGRNELSLTNRHTVDEYRELVYENLSDFDSLGTLLNSILELARIDSKIDKLHKSRVDLPRFLRELTGELEPLWLSKEIQVTLNGPPVFIQADPVGLRQIFMNLLNNAWKYAPIGTVIDFRWKLSGDWVQIVLTNLGDPIPAEDLELIFKRFFRSSKRNQSSQGTGLGLSIVRSLVTLHGGAIRAFNLPTGGVAFEIKWPTKK